MTPLADVLPPTIDHPEQARINGEGDSCAVPDYP